MRKSVLAAMAAALCATGASAHHSTVEFDYTKVYAVTGTVKELQWTNPHSWLQVMVPDENGDQVTVVFCPTKNARPRGTLMFVYREGQETLNGVAANFFRGELPDDPLDLPRPPPLPAGAE